MIWLKNHKAEAKEKASKKKTRAKFVKTWDLRAVVVEKMRGEIKERIKEQSGANPGSAEFISAYKSACTWVMEQLSPEQKAEFRGLAAEWNSGKLTDEVRSGYVKHSSHIGVFC
jgi:hypothetical protein